MSLKRVEGFIRFDLSGSAAGPVKIFLSVLTAFILFSSNAFAGAPPIYTYYGDTGYIETREEDSETEEDGGTIKLQRVKYSFFNEDTYYDPAVDSSYGRTYKKEVGEPGLDGDKYYLSFDSAFPGAVNLGNGGALNFGNEFSLVVKARVNRGGGGYLISKRDGDKSQYGLAVSKDTGGLLFVYGSGRGAEQIDLNFSTEDWRDGEWHEFAVTVREARPPSSVWVTGYVDGEAYRQRNTAYRGWSFFGRSRRYNGIHRYADVPVLAGARGDGAGGYSYVLDGAVSDVKLYDRHLSSQEILELSSSGDVQSGLAGWWDLQEGEGPVAYDGMNGNTGFVDNACWGRTDHYTERVYLNLSDKNDERILSSETRDMETGRLIESLENEYDGGVLINSITRNYEYYGDSDLLKKEILSSPDADGVSAYEYFYDDNGSGPELIRQRRYYGDLTGGTVKEFLLTGQYTLTPELVLDKENSIEYYRVLGDGAYTTLTMRYYETFPPEVPPANGEAWWAFELGTSGENVYVREEFCGTYVKKILVNVQEGVVDPAGIDWSSPVPIPKYGEPVASSYTTVYEIDIEKDRIYDIDPHFGYARPYAHTESYPFVFHDSGLVRYMFQGASSFGGAFVKRDVPAQYSFTRALESAGIAREYIDEAFYPEYDTELFLRELVYQADNELSGSDAVMSSFKEYLVSLYPRVASGSLSCIADMLDDIRGYDVGKYEGELQELLEELYMARPYQEHGRLIKKSFPDGTYEVFRYGPDGTDKAIEAKKYSPDGVLLEKRDERQEKEILLFGNMPWIRYGEGLGRNADDWYSGYGKDRSGWEFLTGREELTAALSKWKGTEDNPSCVRTFLFGDLRGGINFSAGVPESFDDEVIADMGVLLEVARDLNIKLIPVLMDYRMAGEEGEIGPHPDIITDDTLVDGDKTKADKLAELMAELVSAYSTDPNIYAWEIMNEPEVACDAQGGPVPMDDMNDFIRKFVHMIHDVTLDEATGQWNRVTVGSLTKGYMSQNWMVPDNALPEGHMDALDVYQFHYYDSNSNYHTNDHEDLNFRKADLDRLSAYHDPYKYFYAPNYTGGKPVIAGELYPTYIQDKLDTLALAGYDGMLFWDDKGNILDDAEFSEGKDWFYGKLTSYYSTGSISSERGPGLDDNTAYVHYDEQGRVDIEIYKKADRRGSIARRMEYHGTSNNVALEEMYHTAVFADDPRVPTLSNRVVSREYSTDGSLIGDPEWGSTFYEDTWYKHTEVQQEAEVGVGDFYYRSYINEFDQVNQPALHGKVRSESLKFSWGDEAYVYTYTDIYDWQVGRWVWEDIDHSSDPDNPGYTGFVRYDSWRDEVTYYNPADPDGQKKMESRTMTADPDNGIYADEFGNVYYHYIDEDIEQAWNYSGMPRPDEVHRYEHNEKGELAFEYDYFKDSTQPRYVYSYSTIGMAQEDKVADYEFDAEGRICSVTMHGGPNSKGEKAFDHTYYNDTGESRSVTSYTDVLRQEIYGIYEYDPDGSFREFIPGSAPAEFTFEGREPSENNYKLKDGAESFYERLDGLMELSGGEGCKVALLDSGIDIAATGANVTKNVDLTGEGAGDTLGHGTKIAQSLFSVSPAAELFNVKVLNKDGRTDNATLSEAVSFSMDMGANILIMPFTLRSVSGRLKKTVCEALQKGALILAAAGNNGRGLDPDSLAAQQGITSVGSADGGGDVQPWSNYGENVDIYAPVSLNAGEETSKVAGTSYSTALAGGVAALLMAENPDLGREEVFKALKNIFDLTGGQENVKVIKGTGTELASSKKEILRKNITQFSGYSLVDTRETVSLGKR